MFFSRRAQVNARPAANATVRERLLPGCYDQFRGTKIHGLLEHPSSDGDRVFMSVPYACSASAKALGARWDPEARRWWYVACSTPNPAHDDIDGCMQVLVETHEKSVFAEWPVDVEFMKRARRLALADDYFDYRNPASTARAK